MLWASDWYIENPKETRGLDRDDRQNRTLHDLTQYSWVSLETQKNFIKKYQLQWVTSLQCCSFCNNYKDQLFKNKTKRSKKKQQPQTPTCPLDPGNIPFLRTKIILMKVDGKCSSNSSSIAFCRKQVHFLIFLFIKC